MNIFKFYTCFSFLNILLIIFLVLSIEVVSSLFSYDWQGGLPYSTEISYLFFVIYFTYMAIKLLLPKIIVKMAKRYRNSIVNKFVQFLYDNISKKKMILALAFCFDLPFISYCVSLFHNGYTIFDIINYTISAYFMFYIGGIFIFYIMLYYELKNYE